MVRFENVDLYVNEEDEYVNFAIKPEVNFEDHEKGITWSFTMKFFEHDIITSDDFIHEVTKIIEPEITIEAENIIIKPNKIFDNWIKEKIKKDKIDYDYRKAKIYVDLKLKPLQTLTPAFIRSDIQEIHE